MFTELYLLVEVAESRDIVQQLAQECEAEKAISSGLREKIAAIEKEKENTLQL